MSVLNLSNQIALGIDIGGTNTKFGIVNHRGDILAKGTLKTSEYEKVEDFIDALYDKVKPILDEQSQGKTFEGIGIGAPNANYFKGTIEHAPNLRWKGVIPFAKMMT